MSTFKNCSSSNGQLRVSVIFLQQPFFILYLFLCVMCFSACFILCWTLPSQPLCSPSSWHHRGQTGACQKRPEAPGWARGHRNHKNPDPGMAAQQPSPVFRRSCSMDSVILKDFIFLRFVPVIKRLLCFHFGVFLPSYGVICCSSFLFMVQKNLKTKQQPQHSWKRPKVNSPSQKTWQLMRRASCFHISALLRYALLTVNHLTPAERPGGSNCSDAYMKSVGG